MMYDLAAIFNFSCCIFSIYTILIILSKGRRKLYHPPEIRKRYIIGLIAFLSIPSISLGAIVRVVTLGFHKDPIFALFGTLACIAIVMSALQFLSIAKEKEISIIDSV